MGRRLVGAPLVRPWVGVCALVLGCGSEPTAPVEEGLAPVAAEVETPPPDRVQPADHDAQVTQPAAAPAAEPTAVADDTLRSKQELGRVLDRQIADNAGVPGTIGENRDGMEGGIGGLVGAKGGQIGAGGLGSRGSGLGGGGTAEGLGGLGTRGIGSGASGYGTGGGSFGAHGTYVPSPSRRLGGGDTYTDHGVNAMTLAAEDPLSTFSIDVDTASYTNVRRMIQSAGRVPPAAVRVEEFVNYLPYSYPQPTGMSPFSVSMEAAPHPWIAHRQVLRVGIQGRDVDVERKPVHLTFLVDTSCSMTGPDRLPLAQRALEFLVDHLEPTDTVALATYAGGARAVLAPISASHAADIDRAIADLRSGGGTAMGAGIDTAYEMASAAYVEGHENRVVILSDGDANIGSKTHDQLLDQIAGYAGKGITLSTIGFGRGNYRDTLMEQFANKGDGNNYYVDSMAEAKRIFGDKLSSTLVTIARDVKIQVEFDPDAVRSYRLLGYENRDIADKDFRNDKVDAGEVGSGHQVTAIYELVLADDAAGDLAIVRVRSKVPGPDRPAVERAVAFPVRAIRDELADASTSTKIAFAAATFAEILRESPYAEEVSLAQVRDLIREAGATAPEAAELLRLVELADGQGHYGTHLISAAP